MPEQISNYAPGGGHDNLSNISSTAGGKRISHSEGLDREQVVEALTQEAYAVTPHRGERFLARLLDHRNHRFFRTNPEMTKKEIWLPLLLVICFTLLTITAPLKGQPHRFLLNQLLFSCATTGCEESMI